MTGWESNPVGIVQKVQLCHSNKWYMHKQESVVDNEMHKILWDFEIQMDHLILIRKPDQLINKKKKEFAI